MVLFQGSRTRLCASLRFLKRVPGGNGERPGQYYAGMKEEVIGMNGRKAMGTGWGVSLPRGVPFCAVMIIALCFFAPAAQGKSASGPGGGDGLYVVTADVVPMFEKPAAKVPRVTDLWELPDFYGIVVYGNHVRLRAVTDSKLRQFAGGWYALLSPEDGTVLSYIQKKGIEKVPEYTSYKPRSFMVKKDGAELRLQPGKGGSAGHLSIEGFSLVRGETVTAVGEYSEGKENWLLLEFSTDTRFGSGGVGSRYAWGKKADFGSLEGYGPDNARVDKGLLPSKMRYSAMSSFYGDGFRGMDGPEKLTEFLPVTKDMVASLLRKGFYIDDPWAMDEYALQVDDLADYYRYTTDYQADFITTDLFLHAFHLVFDRMLQKFERTYLAPALGKNMKTALSALSGVEGACASAGAGETWNKARDLFAIPLALLEEKPGTRTKLSKNASEEVRRILAAKDVTDSAVTGAKMDYTSFRPRGHYTIRPELERYFRAMSWLGSAELVLFADDGTPKPGNVAAAALVSLVLGEQEELWNAFEAPIDFLVGASNTGGTRIYRRLAEERMGTLAEAHAGLADEKVLSALAEEIKKTVPGPLIQSTPGGDDGTKDFASRLPVFRMSGKRFTPDAYVMNMLTSPRVGTDANPRNLPEGTDVMAALGSKAAVGLAAKNNGVKGYAEALKKLKTWINEHLGGEETVYSLWIKAFHEGFRDSGSDQFFYRSPAWQWKKLSTFSASWAELKHDTVLYAEQSGAEMGDGGDTEAGPFAPPQPKGYVEPDPRTFDALLSAVTRLKAFIAEFGMEPEDEEFEKEGIPYASRLETLAELLTIARDIAAKETGGTLLTAEDYGNIKYLARAFNAQLLLPGEMVEDTKQLRMALVTDIAADYFEGRVLHIGSGRPRRIHVFVHDASGGPRVTRGFIFSYYEFPRSLGDGRMTDEEWKALVYNDGRSGELKQYHPAWYEELRK
jgi:hypothetical protein